MAEIKDVSTIAKMTKLFLSLAPLIAAIAGLVVALNATLGVSENKDSTDLAYTTLAERVNKISEDVAYIKGRMDGRSQARQAGAQHAAFAVMLLDSSTDAAPAHYAPLPGTLQMVGK